MAPTTQRSAEYRQRLDAQVSAFSLFIRDLCPEANLDISFAYYEDEDGDLSSSRYCCRIVQNGRGALLDRS
jgi:hypothetical protein